mmetsp:Transcript_69805/g.167587  ORF Transcript_69805/g.167587 Transcript_69805/m.167587 type:complete len:225 (-) Transcript_69805:3769-4443(-)
MQEHSAVVALKVEAVTAPHLQALLYWLALALSAPEHSAPRAPLVRMFYTFARFWLWSSASWCNSRSAVPPCKCSKRVDLPIQCVPRCLCHSCCCPPPFGGPDHRHPWMCILNSDGHSHCEPIGIWKTFAPSSRTANKQVPQEWLVHPRRTMCFAHCQHSNEEHLLTSTSSWCVCSHATNRYQKGPWQSVHHADPHLPLGSRCRLQSNALPPQQTAPSLPRACPS